MTYRSWSVLPDSQLLDDKDLFLKVLKLALTPDNKKPSTVDRVDASPSIENIHQDAVTILAAIPTFTNMLMHLEGIHGSDFGAKRENTATANAQSHAS
uniref:hypothetical protein n=1 Tax=Pseudomonas putida TaxID=303 RepID=UPI001C63F5AB|nr:hypothetical protein [Pseudomonas putida]